MALIENLSNLENNYNNITNKLLQIFSENSNIENKIKRKLEIGQNLILSKVSHNKVCLYQLKTMMFEANHLIFIYYDKHTHNYEHLNIDYSYAKKNSTYYKNYIVIEYNNKLIFISKDSLK